MEDAMTLFLQLGFGAMAAFYIGWLMGRHDGRR